MEEGMSYRVFVAAMIEESGIQYSVGNVSNDAIVFGQAGSAFYSGSEIASNIGAPEDYGTYDSADNAEANNSGIYSPEVNDTEIYGGTEAYSNIMPVRDINMSYDGNTGKFGYDWTDYSDESFEYYGIVAFDRNNLGSIIYSGVTKSRATGNVVNLPESSQSTVVGIQGFRDGEYTQIFCKELVMPGSDRSKELEANNWVISKDSQMAYTEASSAALSGLWRNWDGSFEAGGSAVTSDPPSEDNGSFISIEIEGIGGIVLLLVIAAIIVFIVIRRKKKKNRHSMEYVDW
jgi:hypothetical protein